MLFLVIALLVFITQTLFPSYWMVIALDAFVAALLVAKSSLNAFLSGFAGVGVVWLGKILYDNSQNDGLLLKKITLLFGLGEETTLFIAINIFVGALVGGISALTGYYLKDMLKKTND